MKQFHDPDHWDTAAQHYQNTAHLFTSQFAEAALSRVPLSADSDVLDVATGTGALALAAARSGARVLATDFSPGMVGVVAQANLPNVQTRVMDGQSLDLPDQSFDAVFSIFGVIMFPDWKKGVSEMVRVTRVGGYGVVTTWKSYGAATFLLLGQIREKLFPDRVGMAMPEAVLALSDPQDFARELISAGYHDPQIEAVTFNFLLNVTALDAPDTLFGMSPDWTSLSEVEKAAVVDEVRVLAGENLVLPIPSTALIGVARR
jgi:ubiquinone/menaquinone biosynthesis C-methylase UbiE